MPELRTKWHSWFTSDNLILWGLAFSVAAHLSAYSVYLAGVNLGWWRSDHMPALFKSVDQAVAEARKYQAEHPPIQPQEQLVFVETDPNEVVPEPPKDTKNYSAHNSLAANPEPKAESDVPKIDGRQTHVQKAEDVPQTKKFPLQPTPPKVPTEEAAQDTKPKPKGGPPPGDLALAKTKPAPKPGDGKAESDSGTAVIPTRKRPRRLEEVSPERLAMVGQKMKQDGGVQRRRVVPSFDAKGSTFGEYDAALIRAVSDAWHGMVDDREFARDKIGKVVVQFHLNYDGTVSDMKVLENTVDMTLEIPCRRAISDPSPFLPWPGDMRRIIGAEFREVTFTFYYD